MDCFSSVVWSLGYTGLAEAATFSVVSFTCRWKAALSSSDYGQGPHGTDLARRPGIRGVTASLCDPETPSTYLKGKQKPEPIRSRFIPPRKWRGDDEWMGMLTVTTRGAPRDRHRAYSWPSHLLSAPPNLY